jgi:centromere/kinetochore protein ZW10
MPSIIDPDDFSKSLIAFVTQGKYPESEDTVSAHVTLDVVPKGLQDISVAREKIEVNCGIDKLHHV